MAYVILFQILYKCTIFINVEFFIPILLENIWISVFKTSGKTDYEGKHNRNSQLCHVYIKILDLFVKFKSYIGYIYIIVCVSTTIQ